MNELVKWDEIEHQIDEVRDLKSIVKMQEQVEAIKILIKQTDGSLKTQNKCSRYRIFLEQKAGELYKNMPDERGRPEKSGSKSPTKKQAIIKDAGKDKKTFHKWAKESDIPKEKILEYENLCNQEGKELTTAGLLSHHEKPHVSQATGENEWYTPSRFIESAKIIMGSIDLDPASSDKANEIINAKEYFTIQDNGLDKKWHGNIWMNPPYAQPLVKEFCNLLIKKYQNKEINQACVLVNNATETSFFQDMMQNCAAICFIKGRIKFIDQYGKASGAPLQGQAILYFGKNSRQFNLEFKQYGIIVRRYE